MKVSGDVRKGEGVTTFLLMGFGPRGFAFANVLLVAVWLALSYILVREYQRRSVEPAKAA